MRALGILLLLFLHSSLVAKPSVSVRSDLTKTLHYLLCQKAESPKPQELWDLGVYDTQAEISWIYAERNLTEEDIKTMALQQAEDFQHGGYAFGFCNNQHAWILTTHSERPLFSVDRENLQLDTSLLRKHCETIQLDLAPFEKNYPEKILGPLVPKPEKLSLSLSQYPSGTLSLTCIPFDPKQKGPELWSLVPLGAWAKAPVIKALNSPNALLEWIQSRRLASGLKQLRLGHPKLDTLANQPNPSHNLAHPRSWLLRKKAELSLAGLHLLGENRVKASNYTQMAWLLWNSAQHRRLLLSPEADFLSLRIEQESDEKLLILFLARESHLAQSKILPRRTP